MLYENYKLRIALAVASVKKITDKENGMIIIERTQHSIDIRYQGWSPDTELILRYLVAQIKTRQKVR